MKFAIIAAGEGSRLAAEGIEAPKPLVEIGGEKLIDRLMRIFMDNDAEEIDVICNDRMNLVSEHLRRVQNDGLDGRTVPLHFMVKSTPSSMHSLFELSTLLGDNPVCLTTVDTIFREDDFRRYVASFRQLIADGDADGLMGVTDYIDDEKPLYVETDGDMNISAFLDASDSCHYISGGIYGLTPKSFVTLRGCIDRGESRMRNFQRALIADGLRLKAWPFAKILDIDHASDIEKAERIFPKSLSPKASPQPSPEERE